MDIAKSFTYILEDERWAVKLGYGTLLTFLILFLVPIPLLVGYWVEVLCKVRDGHGEPLPEWGNWGRLFMDGLSVVAAHIVYSLPFLLLFCVASMGMIVIGSMAEFDEEMAIANLLATFSFSACVFLIWYVTILFVSPAILIQYGRTGELGSCFRFGEVIAIIRRNVGDILIVFVAILVVFFVYGAFISTLSFIVPCLGVIIGLAVSLFVGPYVMMMTGHLYGQIAAKESGISPEKWEKGPDIY